MNHRSPMLRPSPCHVVALVLATLLVACARVDTSATQVTLEGTYVRTVNASRSTVTISKEGDLFLVDLQGGSNGEGAVPADCTVKASGPLTGDRIVARFLPVRTDEMTYSKARADREKRTVTLVRLSNGVEVTTADVDGYCGVGADFVGRYARTK
jgi:hypothetical protein